MLLSYKCLVKKMISNICSVARRPFPAGDRVTFNGKDCLCQRCVQPTSPTPKDISTSSSESHTYSLVFVLLGFVLVSYSDYILAKSCSFYRCVSLCSVVCVDRSYTGQISRSLLTESSPSRQKAPLCAQSHSLILDYSSCQEQCCSE